MASIAAATATTPRAPRLQDQRTGLDGGLRHYTRDGAYCGFGKPLLVRSADRSPEHNRAVGGPARSKHLDGAAFDIAVANYDPVALEAAAREIGQFLVL